MKKQNEIIFLSPLELEENLKTKNEVTRFKFSSTQNMEKKVKLIFKRLRDNYEKLIQEYEINKFVNNSQIGFEPILGETYFLYQRIKGDRFLSIIRPDEWNMEFLGSFKLDENLLWEKIE